MRDPEKSASSTDPQQPPSALAARGSRKTKSPQRSSTRIKEHRHPFALYGWGEKQTDTGSQKTHNVCASAPMHEIHESALRAKSRRQVEKRRLAAQRQRAHSADVEKNRRVKPASSENPWMTEYMRCYSARAWGKEQLLGQPLFKSVNERKEQDKNYQKQLDTGLRNQLIMQDFSWGISKRLSLLMNPGHLPQQ